MYNKCLNSDNVMLSWFWQTTQKATPTHCVLGGRYVFWSLSLSSSNWDSAVIKSIFYVGFGIALWSLFSGMAPSSLNDYFGLLVTFLLYIGVYILISIIGWLTIGFPLHWLIQKYTNGSYIFYVALPLFGVVFGLLNKAPVILSLAALFQAIMFRYYLYNKT